MMEPPCTPQCEGRGHCRHLTRVTFGPAHVATAWASLVVAVVTMAGCDRSVSELAELSRVEFDIISRVHVPDSVQLVGAAIDSSGNTVVAWGPDQVGYWLWSRLDGHTWHYVEPENWSGTIGALYAGKQGTLLAVDSSGKIHISDPQHHSGLSHEYALPPVDRGHRERYVAVSGEAGNPIVLRAIGDSVVASQGGSTTRLRATVGDPAPLPILVDRGPALGGLVLSRSVNDGILQVGENDRQLSPHSPATRNAVRLAVSGEPEGEWIVAAAVQLLGGLVVTLADLKSDRRILARLDDRGILRGCRVVASPYALIGRNSASDLAIAGAWDRGNWLLIYKVTLGQPYPMEEARECQ